MRLSDETYEEIKEEVINLFEEYDIRCTPICGFEIALKMGITLIPYSSLSDKKYTIALKSSEDGFLFVKDFREYIYYNDKKRYGRVNMTILHEIGHLALGHPDTMNQDEAEAEASFFAKYAVAPPPLVHKFKPESFKDIMKHFDITKEAAGNAWEYYLNWLNYGQKTYTSYEKRLLYIFKDDLTHDTSGFYTSTICS